MFRLTPLAARAAIIVLTAILLPSVGIAQMTRGSIAGTARDASGAIVPGATMTVINVATNAVQTVVTDAEGFYRVPALEPGRYTVTTELSGFRKVEQRDVIVRAALETPLDVRLDPAGVGETVQVTADAGTAGLNKTNPTIATSINARAIEELPLPGGRNINNLVLTVPNTSSTTGQGTYAINGNRPRNNNYMVDGSDNNDISVTIATSQIVPESVAEFQVMQNPYSVEFGRNSGGQINVITKSGANRFSGDFFDYYQSSGLNSRSNIEKANNLATPPKLIRHQLGGDLGGPVLRDKLFFFGLYQRDTQRPSDHPSTTAVRIPTAAGYAALQNAPLRDGQSAASRQAVLRQIGYLQDVYAASPVFRNVNNQLVNGVPIETGQTNVSILDPSTYHTWLGRGDYRPFSTDNFTLRYSLNDRLDDNAISNLGFGNRFAGFQDLVDTNLAISNAHTFSSNKLNEFRFSLVRRNLDFPENDPVSPSVTITGLFNIGGATNFPQSRITDAYQFSDTVTWSAAKHNVKFGADVRLNNVINNAAFDSKGSFTFDNLQAYMNNNASRVAQALQTASFEVGQWQSFFFVQDDFRLSSALTLNLGLRYEWSDVPLGMFGTTDPQVKAAMVPGPAQADTNNWAPRVGFAYSPSTSNPFLGDGKTVLRGGWGIGYDVIFYNLLTVATNPNVNTLIQNNILDLYPNKLAGSSTPVFNPLNAWTNMPEDLENPESRFYSLTMQRELGNYLFEVGYSGSRGAKGINQIITNPAVLTPEQAATVRAGGSIPTVQARRVHPELGVRTLIPGYVGPAGNDAEAKSEYNAVFVTANRRLSRGLMVNTSYTYSKWMSNNDASLGEGGTGQSSQRPQSMFDYETEWSRSQFDRPHRLAVSYIWEIPGPRTGVLGQIIGGWQLSGVTSGQSGQPFTIITGVDSNGDATDAGLSDRPNINTSGSFVWDKDHKTFTNNGYYTVPLGSNNLPLANSLGDGNAPRNSERGANWWNTDLALMKRFDLPGTVRFTVRVDAFNLFNQDNYGAPVNNMTNTSFGLNNTNNFGRRIIQLGGKFTF
jgi:Carboxypeptidase regulatory-like domain/TonB dependent receptor